VWIPQPALLGDEEDMHEIVAAVKIQRCARELGVAANAANKTA